jgi:PAS domain S-box-containing protein
VVLAGSVTVVGTVVVAVVVAVVVSVVVVVVVCATAGTVQATSAPARSTSVSETASLRADVTFHHPIWTRAAIPAKVRTRPMTNENADSKSGWSALFRDAFNQSRNPMVLLDEDRRHVEVNGAYVQLLGYRPSDLIGRPVYELRADHSSVSEKQWHAALRRKQFTGTIELLRADGGHVTVEYAGHPEMVTGRQLVLFVALRVARGARLRDEDPQALVRADLSQRELEVVKLLAEGMSGPEVAEELRIAHNTVRTHTRNAMTKMNARSRAQLVAKSLAELAYW